MLWTILFLMILFYFIFILLFNLLPMMLWVDMLLRSYVVTEPYYVLADGYPIL